MTVVESPSAAQVRPPAPVVDEAELASGIMHARRPFPTQHIGWKVQTVARNMGGAFCVAYLGRAACIDRLNTVFGFNWTAKYTLHPGNNKLMLCELSVLGVVRGDIGESSKGLSKDLYTDALKRAATQFGVGVSINDVPVIWVNAAQLRKYNTKSGESLAMTDQARKGLDGVYERWLNEVGIKRFGEPLEPSEGVTFEPGEEHSPAAGEDAPAHPDEEGTVATAGEGGAGAFAERAAEVKDRVAATNGNGASSNGDSPGHVAHLEHGLREALAMVGEASTLIEARVRGARGDETMIRALLKNAAAKWKQEHGDEPCPWQQLIDGQQQQLLA